MSNKKKSRSKEFDKIYIQPYFDDLKKKRKQLAQKRLNIIRKQILLDGCPDDDIISETRNHINIVNDNNGISGGLPLIRKAEDTVRGRLWRILLGITQISSDDYGKLLKLKENKSNYIDIRKDTKRTFASSTEYNSRVSEERLVRVLNSYTHKYNKSYTQGMNVIAAGLLYVMPEIYAFSTFSTLVNIHFPTYFYIKKDGKKDDKKNSLTGGWAGAFLAYDIVNLCDKEVFNHLKKINPLAYFFPLIQSSQAICQPFKEIFSLWDFLFSFGVHLNPVIAAAQLITYRLLILNEKNVPKLLQTILNQRTWMNNSINAKKIIQTAMNIIITLKDPKNKILWNNILKHTTDLKVATKIKNDHAYLIRQ